MAKKFEQLLSGAYGDALRLHAEAHEALSKLAKDVPLTGPETFLLQAALNERSIEMIEDAIARSKRPSQMMPEFAEAISSCLGGTEQPSWLGNLKGVIEMAQTITEVQASTDGGRLSDEQLDRLRPTATALATMQAKLIQRSSESLMRPYLGAAAKLLNDPKRAAKAGALELWKERQEGKHPKLRTVELYAAEVMRRWPVLTSSKVICGWSARWTKDIKEGRAPAC